MDCLVNAKRLSALLLLMILLFVPPVGFVLTVTSANSPIWLTCCYFLLLVAAIITLMKWAFLNDLRLGAESRTTQRDVPCGASVIGDNKPDLPPPLPLQTHCTAPSEICIIGESSSFQQIILTDDPPTYEEALTTHQTEKL